MVRSARGLLGAALAARNPLVVAAGILLAVAASLLATAATAASPTTIAFQVTVLHATEGGSVDPGARRFDRLLGKQIRYGGLKVLDTRRSRVKLDQIRIVNLPAGGSFRFRPLDLSEEGVLLAVEAEKMPQGDFRIPKGKPLILGGHPYEDGKIMVVIEAHY